MQRGDFGEAENGEEYDGVILENIDDEGGKGRYGLPSTGYIIFDPNQAKSATHNTGGFSRTSDNILASFIGERGAASMDRAEEATIRMDNLNVAREMEKAGISGRAYAGFFC